KPKVSRTATQYNKENRRKGNVSSVGVEELEISSIGVVNLSNEVHLRTIKGDLEVIKGEVLLGKKEVPTPVIFDELLSDEENKVAQEFLKKNNDIFAVSLEDLKEPCSVANFDIKTTVDTPIRLRPYRMSQKEREIINKEVETMLKAGIILASQSP
ncbi:unnamed protein product, partial [Brachionus calyciflorus]